MVARSGHSILYRPHSFLHAHVYILKLFSYAYSGMTILFDLTGMENRIKIDAPAYTKSVGCE